MIQPCSASQRFRHSLALVSGVLAFLCTARAVPPEYQYTAIDLGWFGGETIFPNALNNANQLVGFAAMPNGDRHAFAFVGGVLTDLGTMGQQQSWAVDINNAGTILAQAGATSPNLTFTSVNGTNTTLSSTFSTVAGINDSGTIAGSTLVSGNNHAVIFDGTSFTQLETTSYQSWSTAINASGQVAGRTVLTNGGATQGFLYDNGSFTLLGSLGGSSTTVYGMNDLGQIVGQSQDTGAGWHPFVYSGGSMIDLGVGGSAYSINNTGQIVGGETGTIGSAFLYSAGNTTWLDLVTDYSQTSFVSLDEATAINDNGLIAGYGTTSNGDIHAFLLSPIQLTPVPEPTTWGIIGGSTLAALIAVRRLRRRPAAVAA